MHKRLLHKERSFEIASFVIIFEMNVYEIAMSNIRMYYCNYTFN